MKEGTSPSPSPLLHRAQTHVRAVTKTSDSVDGARKSESTPPTSPQLGKLIIRAAKSPDRAPSPDYVRTPSTVVGPTSPTSPHRQLRGAYVNVQGEEGKNAVGGITSTEHDCTESTVRLDSNAREPNERQQQRQQQQQQHQQHHRQRQLDQPEAHRHQSISNGSPSLASRHSKALAPSNKFHDTKDTQTKSFCASRSLGEARQRERVRGVDENHPPDSRVDVSRKIDELDEKKVSVKNKSGVGSFGSSVNSRDERSASTELRHPVSARLSFEKSGLCPANLRASGATPKLSRKLLISDLDTPSFLRRNAAAGKDGHESERSDSASLQDEDEKLCDQDDDGPTQKFDRAAERGDRKIKRSESYRMANSPIMFIKKFSGHSEKSSKMFRSPSEELREELLKETINYPESVASPEPRVDDNTEFESGVNFLSPVAIAPVSPRPRALDLEPARVLKYSGNDTEIW